MGYRFFTESLKGLVSDVEINLRVVLGEVEALLVVHVDVVLLTRQKLSQEC